MSFNQKLTQKQAVQHVEEWLSIPVDQPYFDSISDDLFIQAFQPGDTRGDLLTSLIFLENIDTLDNDENHVFLVCGS